MSKLPASMPTDEMPRGREQPLYDRATSYIERFINELAGFPEIAGVGCPKNRRGIDGISNQQDSSRDSECERSEMPRNAVIERMDCAAVRGSRHPAYNICHETFDTGCLDLDVSLSIWNNRVECLFECRNRYSGSKFELGELIGCNSANRASGEFRAGVGREIRIVVDNNDLVGSSVDVHLNSISAGVKCGHEGRKRVFGVSVANTAMGYCFDDLRLLRHDFPGSDAVIICLNIVESEASTR